MTRCGKCETCLELKKVKTSVLKAVNPPFSHADQGVVDLWNEELKRLPCVGPTCGRCGGSGYLPPEEGWAPCPECWWGNT